MYFADDSFLLEAHLWQTFQTRLPAYKELSPNVFVVSRYGHLNGSREIAHKLILMRNGRIQISCENENQKAQFERQDL